MAIKFRCDSCGKKLGVDDRLAGRRGKCPDCGFLFTVPVPGAAPPPPPRVMRQEDTDYSVSLDGPEQATDGPAADPDLLFGRLAVKAGYLTEEQVQGLVGSQARAASDGTSVTLGELCQSRRLLTSGQVQSLLLAQEFALLRAEDKRLGQLAVRNGFATEDDVRAALDEQRRAYGESRTLPRRLGEILVDMGTLSEQQISALLRAQARLAGQGSTSAAIAPMKAAPAEPPAEPLPSTTPSGEAVTGWLVQEAGEAAGTTYAMAAKAILGRQPTNEVPLPETRASRQHAKVEYIALAKQHVVTDLNSRNGTSVNGEPLTGPRALQPGDRIQIGDTVLRYDAGTGVTPGFIPPGVTMAAPGAGMGSQVRRETVAMPAVTPGTGGALAGMRPAAAGVASLGVATVPAYGAEAAPRTASPLPSAAPLATGQPALGRSTPSRAAAPPSSPRRQAGPRWMAAPREPDPSLVANWWGIRLLAVLGLSLLAIAISPLFRWVDIGAGGITGLSGWGKYELPAAVLTAGALAFAAIRRSRLRIALSVSAGFAAFVTSWMSGAIYVISVLSAPDAPELAALLGVQATPGFGVYLGLFTGIIGALSACSLLHLVRQLQATPAGKHASAWGCIALTQAAGLAAGILLTIVGQWTSGRHGGARPSEPDLPTVKLGSTATVGNVEITPLGVELRSVRRAGESLAGEDARQESAVTELVLSVRIRNVSKGEAFKPLTDETLAASRVTDNFGNRMGAGAHGFSMRIDLRELPPGQAMTFLLFSERPKVQSATDFSWTVYVQASNKDRFNEYSPSADRGVHVTFSASDIRQGRQDQAPPQPSGGAPAGAATGPAASQRPVDTPQPSEERERVLQLGQTLRIGDAEVTPVGVSLKKVGLWKIELDKTRSRMESKEQKLGLTLRIKNISAGACFAPVTEKTMRACRVVDNFNNVMAPFAKGAFEFEDYEVDGQRQDELKPGQEMETTVYCDCPKVENADSFVWLVYVIGGNGVHFNQFSPPDDAAIQVKFGRQDIQEEKESPPAEAAPQQGPQGGIAPSANDTVRHPGEDVRLSDSVWAVGRGFEMGSTLHSNNQFQEDATTGGRFVMVAYAVVNNGGKTDRIFIRPDLVDEAGREYEELDGESFYLPEGKETIGMTQLTPGVAKELWAIYEVPSDARGLMFRARSLASKNETALIALDICPSCGGKGRGTCKECSGAGSRECAKCGGKGYLGDRRPAGSCPTCGGAGSIECSSCHGRGSIDDFRGTGECPRCKGRGAIECKSCRGQGHLDQSGGRDCPDCKCGGSIECSSCHGAGEAACSKCEGRGVVKDPDAHPPAGYGK